jgi:hypothetical protein
MRCGKSKAIQNIHTAKTSENSENQFLQGDPFVICCIKNFLLNELNIPSENIF